MPEKPQTQRTEQGLEIPIPTRGQIDDALSRIAKPVVQHEDCDAPREAHVPVPGDKAFRKLAERQRSRKRKGSAGEK